MKRVRRAMFLYGPGLRAVPASTPTTTASLPAATIFACRRSHSMRCLRRFAALATSRPAPGRPGQLDREHFGVAKAPDLNEEPLGGLQRPALHRSPTPSQTSQGDGLPGLRQPALHRPAVFDPVLI